MWLTRLHIIVLTAFLLSAGAAVAAEEGTRGVQVIMKDPPVLLRTLYEKSWAVVVGVNQYPTGGRNYPNLNFAVSDAKRVAEKLEGMGFEVRLLIDRDANRQNIIHALADDVGLKAKDHDRIIFYFAGHGATRQKVDDTNMGYILPHDYDVNRHNATAISVQQLRDISSEIKAKHMLYLMDSCFSGGLLASRGQVPQLGATGFKYLTQISQTRAHVVITAGGKDETVKEDAGSGVFTKVFLDALEKESGMPWSREGYLTAMDLASHIKKRVPELSSQQTPQYGSIDGEGDVVLSIFKPLDVSGGDERSHRIYDAERALQAEEALMRAKKKRNIAAPGF
jgi:uncharacterized caspase-like protein